MSLISLEAQNLSGAEMTYRHISASEYEFSLVVYRDCNSLVPIDNIQTINYGSSTCNSSSSFPVKVSSFEYVKSCPSGSSQCQGGNVRSFEKKTFKGNVSLDTPCNDYIFSWIGFNRSSKINTIVTTSGTALYVEAMLNNLDAPSNSSPIFTANPANFVFLNSTITYNPIVSDLNNDLLSYSLENPRFNPSSFLVYKSPYNKNNPISLSSPLNIDPATGDISISPILNGNGRTDTSITVIKVSETRNGKLIGYVMRDMQMEVFSAISTKPTLSGINGTNNFALISSICIGDIVSFSVIGKTNTNNNLSMSLQSNLPGAILSLNNSLIKTVTGTFVWSPDLPGKKSISIKLGDNACPVEGVDVKTYTIDVLEPTTITLDVPRFNRVNNCTNFGVKLVKATIAGGLAPYNTIWTSAEKGEVVSNTTEIVIDAPGTYYLDVTDAKGCKKRDSVIYQSNLIVLYRYPSDSVCQNKAIKFNNLSTSTNSSVIITRYTWDFGDGSPIFTTTNLSERSPIHTFNTFGNYNVKLTVLGSDGCTGVYIKRVKVYELPVPEFLISKACPIPGNISAKNMTVLSILSDLSQLKFRWLDSAGVQVATSKDATISTNKTKYTLTLEAKLFSCSAKTTTSINLNKKPLITFITPSFTPVCTFAGYPNTTLTVNAIVVDPKALALKTTLGYNWNNGLGLKFNLPIQISNKEDIYKIIVTDTLQCIADTIVLIKDGLTPAFRYSSFFCKPGDPIVVENLSGVRGLPKYNGWNFRNGTVFSATGTNLTTFSPNFSAVDTLVNVYFKIIDQYNCVDSVFNPLIRLLPVLSTAGISKNLACFGEPLSLTSPNGKYINYWIWDYGDNLKDTLWNYRTFTIPGIVNNFLKPLNDSTNIYSDINFNKIKTFKKSGLLNVKITIGYNESSPTVFPIRFKTLRSGCTNTQTFPINVRKELKYQIDTAIYNQCAGIPTKFTAKFISAEETILPTNFKWNFYKSNSVFSQPISIAGVRNGVDTTSVTYTFKESGMRGVNPYFVALQVNDSKGCIGIDSVAIDNISITGYRFINSADRLSCQNVQQQFAPIDGGNNLMSTENVHKWNFGDSSDTLTAGLVQYHAYKASPISDYLVSLKLFGKNNPSTRYGTCYSTFYHTFTLAKAPITNMTISQDDICQQDTLKITPVIVSSYNTPSIKLRTYFTFTDGTAIDSTSKNTFTHVFRKTGINVIRLVAIDTSKCSDTIYKTVKVYSRPKANFSFESSDILDAPFVYANTPINFTDISFSDDTSSALKRKWYWGNGDSLITGKDRTNPNYTYAKSANYFAKLVIQNSKLCSDSISKKIDLTSFMKMPNAFSPNGDGNNDYFSPTLNGIKDIEVFKIYNRWGQLVYDFSGRPDKGWDGTYNGVLQPVGSYVYFIKAKTAKDDISLPLTGNLSLIK